MAIFPTLSTGAVTQYPAVFADSQSVQVIRFSDSADQRFLMQGRTFRRWQIRLDLLNEEELAEIEGFFAAQQGDYGAFLFPDPVSGANVANCRLASPGFTSAYVGVDAGSISLVVMETNG